MPSDFYWVGKRQANFVNPTFRSIFWPHQLHIWLVMLWQSYFGNPDVWVCSDRDVNALMPESSSHHWLAALGQTSLRVKLLNSPIALADFWLLTLKPDTLTSTNLTFLTSLSTFAFFLFWWLASSSYSLHSNLVITGKPVSRFVVCEPSNTDKWMVNYFSTWLTITLKLKTIKMS